MKRWWLSPQFSRFTVAWMSLLALLAGYWLGN